MQRKALEVALVIGKLAKAGDIAAALWHAEEAQRMYPHVPLPGGRSWAELAEALRRRLTAAGAVADAPAPAAAPVGPSVQAGSTRRARRAPAVAGPATADSPADPTADSPADPTADSPADPTADSPSAEPATADSPSAEPARPTRKARGGGRKPRTSSRRAAPKPASPPEPAPPRAQIGGAGDVDALKARVDMLTGMVESLVQRMLSGQWSPHASTAAPVRLPRQPGPSAAEQITAPVPAAVAAPPAVGWWELRYAAGTRARAAAKRIRSELSRVHVRAHVYVRRSERRLCIEVSGDAAATAVEVIRAAAADLPGIIGSPEPCDPPCDPMPAGE